MKCASDLIECVRQFNRKREEEKKKSENKNVLTITENITNNYRLLFGCSVCTAQKHHKNELIDSVCVFVHRI